ncbi:MAG: hypothetical protein AB7I59_15860 [Geminicoccaceae bacterium]
MAVISWGALEPLDFRTIDFARYLALAVTDRAPRFHAGDLRFLGLPDHEVEFFGNGFGYDAAGQLATGTISIFQETVGGQRLGRFSELSVPVEQFRAWSAPGQSPVGLATMLAGDDRIGGSPFADFVNGYTGNDQIDLGGGDDVVIGSAGNDLINGRSGDDVAVLIGRQANYRVVIWADNVGTLPVTGGLLAADGIDKATAIERLGFQGDGSELTIGADNFKPLDYIASYGDLMDAFGANPTAGFDHFIYGGAYEGRSVQFSGFEYLASYPDLEAAFGSSNDVAAAAHYIEAGRFEGRQVTFDGLAYIAGYRDLSRTLGADDDAGAVHYLTIGRAAGREIRFDPLQYIASNDDLIRAFGADRDAGSTHFIEHGRAEGRSPDSFDAGQYLANYADLQAAFGGDENAATIHFITSGFAEGRTDEPLGGAAADFLL